VRATRWVHNSGAHSDKPSVPAQEPRFLCHRDAPDVIQRLGHTPAVRRVAERALSTARLRQEIRHPPFGCQFQEPDRLLCAPYASASAREGQAQPV